MDCVLDSESGRQECVCVRQREGKRARGEMERGEPIEGFKYEMNNDGTINKYKVICKICNKEFQFHRSCSSLRYHVNAKHAFARPSRDYLTNAIAKWIAKDCRPISIVEDSGFMNVLQAASQDSFYKPPSRATVMTKIHELYENEKEKRNLVLAQVNYIALTGDHWTSVSNNNYLGVTAHYISDTWELKSFALTILKTEERHFAEACKEQFLSVARKWDIEAKMTTIGTDSARNMVAAIRLTRYEHMNSVAHMVQRSITVSLADSGFVNALVKARKVVGHFKHSPANAAELQAQQVSLGKKQEPLIQDVPTRWNSTLDMVKRLSSNKEAVIAALDNQEHKLVLPTTAEWDKLQNLETLLEPCRFKTKFKEDLASRQEQLNRLQIATVLDPRFKDLKCLPKTDREKTHDDGPPRKKSLLQMGSDSESEGEEVQPAIHRYRAEPTIKLEDWPLRWWASHSGAHEKLALLAHKYLATPATTVTKRQAFDNPIYLSDDPNYKAAIQRCRELPCPALPSHLNAEDRSICCHTQMRVQNRAALKLLDQSRERALSDTT
ncbi:hypothetical protein DNTS_024589 [Danionella cerebrum]|uniref:HAT C-terminal dimerisation domain-containing protein n=1 Tax=Danionella cerebrum TaxID=2873325 RepID=A0A553NHM4_9TELE|nr:hypothetical protein DNTS_024589 [Danionella translucida]